MKKIFTVLASAAVVFGISAAPKAQGNQDFQAHGLLPEAESMIQKRIDASASVDMHVTPEAKPFQKIWYDQKAQAAWRLTLELMGHVGDLYGWGADGNGPKPTVEEVPYFGVMASFEKEYDDPSLPLERTYWVLWWPSVYEYQELVDNWYTGLGEVDPNLEPVPFDVLCNLHENPEYLELTYCSNFKEVSDKEMPWPGFLTEERDGKEYIVDPTPEYWGMQFFRGYIGNNQMSSSGLVNGMGTPTTFNFQSWDPIDQWLEVDVRMFTNGVRRSEFTYNGKSRVQGWTTSDIALPAYGDVHIFNAGVNSSELAGDTDYYGVTWGPLQQYFMFGVGEYIEFVDTLWEGAFDMSKVRVIDNPDKVAADGVDPYTIQNYFFGMLFSPVDADPTEGTWNMVEPVKIKNDIYLVTPVANSIVPYAVGEDAIPDGFVSVYEGETDFCTGGSLVKTGTTKGLQIIADNGYDVYYGFYDKDIVFHYDNKNMALTKTIPAIGSQTPADTAVNEIEAGEEAPVYFNLQGVRVANPEKGIVIKVQGNKATKLFL